MLQRRLTEHRIDTSAEQRTGLLTSLLSWRVPQRPVASEQLLLEHCELVCRFLKAKTGKLTERVETYKQRSRSSQLASIGGSCTVRQRLISDSRSSNTGKNSSDPVSLDANGSFATGSRFTFSSKLPTDGRSIVNNKLAKDDGSPSTHPANTEPNRLQLQLQLENSELASDLLNTLAATESAVLHLARLQAALQSHLDTQHDLACRLFEESTAVEGDVDRGNRYLRGSAEGSSAARRILVAMMLMASLILLLLHYLK